MNFQDALSNIKGGNKVARTGWNGKDMFIRLQTPASNSKMTLPYIFMRTADQQLVPWLCSQTDMLADDWEVVG